MKALLKRAILFTVALFTSFLLFSAEETFEKMDIGHLYSYTLDNGLSVFVAENHSAPLVYIEIAVRTGSVAQTKENAGLFHLYEHMMFKGNPKYPNAQLMKRALNDMGCADSNGITSIDRVNYFVTVPVDQFENGLEFWSYAIRQPLIDPKEFEDEKKVVISEIQGYFGQPSEKRWAYMGKTLFPQAPWSYDPGGSISNIQNATIVQLKEIQNKYYIPNNAALFIGGDVNPEKACELANKIYGDWKAGEDPWEKESLPYALNPLTTPKYCVLPTDEVSEQLAQIIVTYRGADADYNLHASYVGDVLSKVMQEPVGVYKKTMLKNKKLQLPDSDYLWAGYDLSRRHGLFSFYGIVLNPADKLPERTKDFYDTLTKKALPAVMKDKSLESEKKRNMLLQILKDSNAWERQTAQNQLSTLSYYWTNSTRDSYFAYEENVKKITKKDADLYIGKYILNSNPLITVLVNPAVYEQTKEAFENAGFEEITEKNAFWWAE